MSCRYAVGDDRCQYESYTQSILHRPSISASERAHALLCLGMDFRKAGFRNRAMDTFRKVVELEPSNAYALRNLIKIHEEEHDWEQALSMEEKLSRATGNSDSTLGRFCTTRSAKPRGRLRLN